MEYQLKDLLGEGGMGVVYRAIDTRNNRVVAIKQLHKTVAIPKTIDRLKREGEALRDLNHPNIVKLIEAIEHDGTNYLVIEYVSGGDLAHVLGKGKLSLETTLKLAIDLADALTRAHKLNIIHRDLKPANMLIAEDGTLRLTDFGLAQVGIEASENVSRNRLVGTLDYMSPEVFEGKEVDTRTDIWSFGVILFEMLAGVRPFVSKNMPALIAKILQGNMPDLEQFAPHAPIELIDLVYRMLDRDRDRRIQSVRIIGAELEAIAEGRSVLLASTQTKRTSKIDFSFRPKHNLPAQVTPFIGRGTELQDLVNLLTDLQSRLVTLLAPGGMGKTRLALEVATALIDDFDDGVYFVSLAPLSETNSIIVSIADAIGYQFNNDENNNQTEILLKYLNTKHMLLILDNFEHLMDGSSLVTDLLQQAPQLKILVTSRQRLNQVSETIYNLAGLDLPSHQDVNHAGNYGAVGLFMQTARRVQPQLVLSDITTRPIINICQLVQGMPLGILLAASWLSMLSVDEVAEEIQQGIDILDNDMADLPERHQSIRAVFDYSWQLLNDAERNVFMQLSIFRGRFTRDAAQAVTQATLRTLMSLMNKSLLRRDANTGYYDIHELLRKYAYERLHQHNRLKSTQQAHMTYYADYMERLRPRIKGEHQTITLDEIEHNFPNVRAAWFYAVEQGDKQHTMMMFEGLSIYCKMRSRYQDSIAIFQVARAQFVPNPEKLSHRLQGYLLLWGWEVETFEVWSKRISDYSEAILSLAEETDDKLLHGLCYVALGTIAASKRAFHQSITLNEKAYTLMKAHGDIYHLTWQTQTLAFTFSHIGDQPTFEKYTQEFIDLSRQIGDKNGIGFGMSYQAWELLQENHKEAIRLFHEIDEIWRSIDHWAFRAASQATLAVVYLTFESDVATSERYAMNGIQVAREFDFLEYEGFHLVAFGYLSLMREAYHDAKTHFDHAEQLLIQNPAISARNYSLLVITSILLGDRVSAIQYTNKIIGQDKIAQRLERSWVLALVVVLESENQTLLAYQSFVLLLVNTPDSHWCKHVPFAIAMRHRLEQAIDDDTRDSIWQAAHALNFSHEAQALFATFDEENRRD